MIGRRSFLLGAAGLAASAASAQVFRPGQLPNSRPGFRIMGTGDDPDVSAYADRLTTPPSTAERARLNALVTGLKTDGAWTVLDRLHLLAAETQQAGLRDIRNAAKSLTIAGGVTFTTDRGFTADGSTGYLDAGEAFNAAGNQYALNSACAGVWVNAEGTAGTKPHIGTTAAARNTISARNTSGAETFQANDTTSDTLMASNLSRVGHRAYSRTGANTKRGFFNGSRTADLTSVSTAVNTANALIFRSGSTFADDRAAAFYFGAGISDALMAAIHARLSTYLSSKGAA